jgi:hypothetical protein
MIQFFIKMSAVIAAAYFAVNAPEIGGLQGLMTKVQLRGPGGRTISRCSRISRTPGICRCRLHHADRGAVVGGVVSRREPGGGSYIAQECSRPGRSGTPWARPLQHRALRAAPVAVDSRRALPLIIYPDLSDIQRQFHLDPSSSDTTRIRRCCGSCRPASSG